MEMDLNARNSKWKREEQRRRDQAKRKLQTEQLMRAAAEKARRELEAVQAQKRVEQIEEAARAEERALEEQRATGGIKYLQQLRPVPTTTDGDKITLPVSALEELNPQDAHELGVFTFELTCSTEHDGGATVHRTHAGVLEFVAEEGTVGLPPKVAASLCALTSTPGVVAQLPAVVQVKFVRLEKGTFARLQPRGDGFGEREIDFKHLLERALQAHTTLTVGDVLFVRHGRKTFEVAVAELRPERAVNILNTDLEVALLPSEAVAYAAEQKQQREDAAAAAAAQAKHDAEEKERRRSALMAQLATEPPTDERAQVKIALRLPGGGQQTRRFRHTQLLGDVFAFVEALTGDAASSFQFAATFPRRVFGVDARAKTLSELGLNGRQEALFVESVAVAAAAATDAPSQHDGTVTVVDTESMAADAPTWTTRTLLPAQWENARQLLETSLDESLSANTSTPIHALEPIMPVAQSSNQETKWEAQLLELAAMGFHDRARNVQVLERYQGRLLRVVNYLSELSAREEAAAVVDDGVTAMSDD